MRTRRDVLRTMKIAALVSAIPVRVNSAEDEIHCCAEALASALIKLHGGDWRVKIDGRGEFVLVSKRVG